MKSSEIKGYFSKNLFSLQIQLKTLFDGAGGRDACELLDRLSELTDTEQKISLKSFQRTLDRFVKSDHRVCSEQDRELQAFEKNLEEDLYQDLVDGMNAWKREAPVLGFTVVDGGKIPSDKKTVCLEDARKRFRSSSDV